MIDGVFDFKDIYNYKCDEREYSKMPMYCSKREKRHEVEKCDISLIYKTECSEELDREEGVRRPGMLPNNCY